MKIYIIDNHPLYIDSLATLLPVTHCENKIYKFTNSLTAVEQLDKDPIPDLIFINIHMPTLNGIDFLKTLEQRKTLSPVIILSDNNEDELLKELVNFDVSGLIPKAYTKEQTLSALDKIFNGESYIPETVELRLTRTKRLNNNLPENDTSINALGVTRRQREVLKLAAQGHPNKAIALLLNISEHTVKSHIAAMFHLLHAKTRAECIQRAYETRLIKPPGHN